MKKYFLALRAGPDHVTFREIEAEPVTIEGFEDFHLFLHHPLGIWLTEKELWVISEATTGVAITGWATSPEEAKVMVKEKLGEIGAEVFQEKIEAHIKKFGLTSWDGK